MQRISTVSVVRRALGRAARSPARLGTWLRLICVVAIVLTTGVPSGVQSQPDPRRYHHSVNIVPFVEGGEQKYYLSWSSSHAEEWEHDIYSEVVHFNLQGDLVIDHPAWRLVGTGDDGAQEPVSVALAPRRGVLLSAWEDGTDLSVVVDVRGQLHTPDGRILRRNFQIAGGPDAQHSAAAAHCGGHFLVAYVDEAPPAQYATVLVKVVDDSTGTITQTLRLTSDSDDNWWPVIASDGRRYALVGWGNGETFSASLLRVETDSFSVTGPRMILGHVDQYYYSVRWIGPFQRFLVVARYGGVSRFCWIDTSGVPSGYARVPAPVTRETHFAVMDQPGSRACLVTYTTGRDEVALVRSSPDSTRLLQRLSPDRHPELGGLHWVSTGIALQFISPATGGAFADSRPRLLIAQNDDASDDLVMLVLPLDAPSAVRTRRVQPGSWNLVSVSRNPFRDATTVMLRLSRAGRVRVELFDVRGRTVAALWDGPLPAGTRRLRFAPEALPAGVYFLRVMGPGFVRLRKMVRVN